MELRINRVRISRARPVFITGLCTILVYGCFFNKILRIYLCTKNYISDRNIKKPGKFKRKLNLSLVERTSGNYFDQFSAVKSRKTPHCSLSGGDLWWPCEIDLHLVKS